MEDKYERLSHARTRLEVISMTNIFGVSEQRRHEIEKEYAAANREFLEALQEIRA